MMKLKLSLRKSKKYYSTHTFASHCGYCGTSYSSPTWPKLCACCSNTTFRNPIPVAVGLLPFVNENHKFGLLLVERAIKPCIGEFCLPGGFIDWGESWQEAISREIFEETTVITHPDEWILADTHSTPDGTRVLIFGKSRIVRSISDFKNFKPGTETNSIKIGDSKHKLCFSLHQEVYNKWFTSKYWLLQENKLE